MRLKKINKYWIHLLTGLAAFLPTSAYEALTTRLITKRAEGLSPEESVRFLLRLDTAQYPIQSQAAIRYNQGSHPKHRLTQYHDFFVEHVKKGERVLDIGCGQGDVDFDLVTKSGASVDGIDLSAENIAKAQKRYSHPNLSFRVADALTLHVDRPYDTIILSNVLEHIRERVPFLRRINAQVKPRRFLIRVPMFDRDWRVALKREVGVEERLDEDHKIEFTAAIFANEMQQAGLTITFLEVRWGEIWAELAT